MDDLRTQLEQALSPTYTLERELGGGGMSRRYLAREVALDRWVVIKVLAPELLEGVSVERFRREILLAAQLQHPHVVPVLAAGDAGGIPWFAMPYVEGQSLRQRLAEGPLEIGEVISTLRDVARALAYAHARGIVHRDIKPGNVLLSSGSATVTDFGIAKAISAARKGEAVMGATLTRVGTSIGTPTYMSPEQALGDPNIDHRADLYSFGVLAYELLTGHPPFQAEAPARMLAAHMGETPRDVREVRADCPAPLAELVMACLAKDPGERPSQAGNLARVLDSITARASGATVPAVLRGGRIPLGKAAVLWAAATGGVVVTAWAAMVVVGLPDWVFPGSVGIMLAGLPVIGITWWVQRTVHRTWTAPQLRPPAPLGTMATIAIKASPHLSWRRTWLGGAVTVGAFAVLVVGYMVPRALGIGPAASLRGTGAFGERETLVVANFRAPATDSTLGPTVAEALRTDLAQSRALTVLSKASLRERLTLMARPAEGTIPFALAREIATREGAKAVLDGAVVRLGSSYVISARLVSALDGAELATFRATASTDDNLIPALGKLSKAVRERAGESFRTIRASQDLDRVTTPSLSALRKYVDGFRLADEQGDIKRGLASLEAAVALVTAFAMAWRKIAVLLTNEGRDRTQVLAAIQTAYRHRDRLTEMEQLYTEGSYYTFGPEPDLDRALAAYEKLAQLDSTAGVGLNNAAGILTARREFGRAEELYRKVVRLRPWGGGAFANLIGAQISNRRGSAALDSTMTAFRERFPNNNDLWEVEWAAAWGKGDLAGADSISRATNRAAKTLRQTTRSAWEAGSLARLRGHSSEALRWRTLASEALLHSDASERNRLNFVTDSALVALDRDDLTSARQILDRGLRRVRVEEIPPSERPWGPLAILAAATGDVALARRAQQGFEQDQSSWVNDPAGRRAFHAAHVALAGQEYAEAISLLQEADRRFGINLRYAATLLGHAHDQAGKPDSAIVYYERFVTTQDPSAGLDSYWRPRVHYRLGKLHEAKGNRKKATAHYNEFLSLWKDAEPALQPMVREARQRLERLVAEKG